VLRLPLTRDVHLRLLETGDAEELQALIEANRDRLARWMPWAIDEDLEATRAFIALTRRQIADDNGFQTAIVDGDRIAGMVGFHGVDWSHRSASIGYWIGAEHEGRGLMTRAVRALVDHAFGVWRLNRVEIHAAPENGRSQAVAERLGFTREGTLRQAERVGERYLDSVVFSLLASEWEARPGEPGPA
jgi:ribosomal-protein-serine acetyltransferase